MVVAVEEDEAEEDAEEESSNLLLEGEVDNKGQIRVAFWPDTTTRLVPDLLFVGWSDNTNIGAVSVLSKWSTKQKLVYDFILVVL